MLQRQQRVRAHLHGRAVLGLDQPAADQVAQPVGLDVLAGEHGQHAGHGLGRGLVDAADPRMGVRAAHEVGVGLAVLVDVVGVAALAGDEALVLLADDRGADALLSHRSAPHSAACRDALHVRSGGQDRLDDVVVARAAADVALEPLAHLVLARVGVLLQQVGGAHQHAGRAEAALQAVMLAERLLQRVQLAALGQALDRRHLGAVGLGREHGAGLDRIAVDMDHAGAALAGVAADMGAGEAEIAAQEIDQQRARLDLAARPACR